MITCRLEMAGQNVRLADPLIREEAVGCLGIRPILADERNALSHGTPNLLEQFAESVAEPRVLNLASTKSLDRSSIHLPKDRETSFAARSFNVSPIVHPPRESGAQQGITSDSFDSRFADQRISPSGSNLRVIESLTGGLR